MHQPPRKPDPPVTSTVPRADSMTAESLGPDRSAQVRGARGVGAVMRTLALVLTAAAAALAAGPAAAQVGDNTIGPDYVTSPNVEYLGSIKDDIGQTTGSKIVGDRLYVTSAKNLSIY